MFIFLRLVLAHLIADFPLQTDEIYRLKVKGQFGQFLHAFVIVAVSALFVAPFLTIPSMWAVLAFIGVCHYIIDNTKLIWNDRIKDKWLFWGFLLDQALHIATALPCFFITALSNKEAHIAKPAAWALFYNDNTFVIYAIFFVIAVFSSTYIIESFKIAYMPGFLYKNPPRILNYYKLFERFVIFTATYLSGIFLVFIPAIVALRKPLSNMIFIDHDARKIFLSVFDTGMNIVVAMSCGIILQYLI